MYKMYKVFASVFVIPLIILAAFHFGISTVQAADYGVHILRPEELKDVAKALHESRGSSPAPLYVTIPFSLEDTKNLESWQESFDVASRENIIPLIRFVSRFESDANAWKVPTQYDVVKLSQALGKLRWPQDERHIILFNEPNHDAEWGGQVDPKSYADIALFAAQWLHTEKEPYVILPAAADLAAPNGSSTMEAFTFWKAVLSAQPELLSHFDAWNSHSYPNPGFVGSPQASGQNSLRGFEHEMQFLSQYSNKSWPIYITETGWKQTRSTEKSLARYYEYADDNIWSDDDIVAVTPFLWQGAPGPFAEFSMQSAEKEFTVQGKAWLQLIANASALLLTDSSVR